MLPKCNVEHELQEILDKMKHFPCGPVYRSIHKQLATLNLESGKQDKGIEHLVESHATSLRMKAYLKYDKSRCDNNGETCALDGSLVQMGSVPLLDRLSDMPEEWTVIQISYTHDPEDRLKAISKPACNNPGALHMMRFVCGEKARQQLPYCITVPIPEKYSRLSSELSSILQDQKERLVWSRMTSQEYRMLRSTIASRMKNVVQKLESNWLGPWSCMFVGHYVEQSSKDKLNEFVDRLLKKYAESNPSPIFKNAHSHDVVRQLAKASIYVPEWELRKGLAQFLNIASDTQKEMASEIRKVHDVVRLETSRRHPVILILDEELEMFPWEMLNVILDHTVCRMPSLHMLHALYTAHKERIIQGRLQLDVGLGYFIVNPQQNLPNNEKRMRPFLTYRTPSWVGTFGIRPSSDDFKEALQKYNVFVYSGHGSGSEFLQEDEIQKLRVRAVTFLFGCSSVTSKCLGGRVEPYGTWHFYHLAGCAMVVGNLWTVTDIATDAIMMDTLNNWLPQRDTELGQTPFQDMKEMSRPKHDPDLLYAIRRSRCSVHHYMATAALVFRGLPVTATGSVEKPT